MSTSIAESETAPNVELIPVFDGHNDLLLRFRDDSRSFFTRQKNGHIDLPRAQEGGLAGGFCAIFVPSEPLVENDLPADDATSRSLAAFADESTMPPTPDLGYAQQFAMARMSRLIRIVRESQGQMEIVCGADDIERCVESGVFAALMHMEGAEAIDPHLDALEVFHEAGLRSIGPVWSRPNEFGRGVPFKSAHSPDTGPGLTDAGKALVRACNQLKILVDLSHLNEQGFWDVAGITEAPLVATHSNAHALSPGTRNLTDRQLDSIRDSNGLVGINFHVAFLREDGRIVADTPLEAVVRHVDYLVERIGIDRVGFGSDFDGCVIPRSLGDATGLPKLLATLRDHGYDRDSLRKLAHGNWIRVLRATWQA